MSLKVGVALLFLAATYTAFPIAWMAFHVLTWQRIMPFEEWDRVTDRAGDVIVRHLAIYHPWRARALERLIERFGEQVAFLLFWPLWLDTLLDGFDWALRKHIRRKGRR